MKFRHLVSLSSTTSQSCCRPKACLPPTCSGTVDCFGGAGACGLGGLPRSAPPSLWPKAPARELPHPWLENCFQSLLQELTSPRLKQEVIPRALTLLLSVSAHLSRSHLRSPHTQQGPGHRRGSGHRNNGLSTLDRILHSPSGRWPCLHSGLGQHLGMDALRRPKPPILPVKLIGRSKLVAGEDSWSFRFAEACVQRYDIGKA